MSNSYDPTKAEEYWSTRLHDTTELAAVLSFSLPESLNRAYSEWEIRTLLRSLPALRGLKVVDVACGVGRVTVPLAQEGAIVTSFDNSSEMLAACKRNVEAAGVGERVTFQKGSADALPFDDGSFDVVVCVGLLEHLPAEVRQRTLDELVRVMRRPGALALVVNNPRSRFLSQENLYSMQDQQANGYFVSLVGKDAVVASLQRSGLEVSTCGSNLFQSLVKHMGQKLGLFTNKDIMADLTSLSMKLDIEFPSKGDLDVAFADQWVLVGSAGPR